MSTPTVPARPSRSAATTSSNTQDPTPTVPPRPTRKTDPSPSRDLRSPLNDMPALTKTISKPSKLSAEETPARPPSVTLPSVGQEGSEYAATYDLLPPDNHGTNNAVRAEAGTPEQTRNVAEGMTLHAPVASLPQSTAKSKIQTVTRTDSSQAAAVGIGKARPDDDVHKGPADSFTSLDRVPSTDPSSLHARGSGYNRPHSGAAHGSRPASVYEDFHEQGIPQIGVHAPLNPNAGDVQAPSPGLTQSQYSPGVGFFNDGSSRAHQRKRSGRHEFYGPPGSYGLHSHSLEPHDRFEKEWYERNKDKAQMEAQNLYRIPKPETALSSAELNRIVTQSEDGTTPALGTPSDDIGWNASDAFAARASPKGSPVPTRERKKRPSSGSQPATESPLRRTSYGFSKAQPAIDDDDVDVIHIDESEYRDNQGYRRESANGSADTSRYAGNGADENDDYYARGGTPALASDEVLKRHESATMHAAVTSDHFDSYDEYAQYDNSRRSSFRAPSRPSSRPGSIHGDTYHGGNLHRFISHEDLHHGSNSHTPLEEIEEYEPLIPEDDVASPKRSSKTKEVKRRPGIEHHHFPSQDVWEDTPSSLYYHTTVQNAEEEIRSPESATAPKADDALSPQKSNEQGLTTTLSNGQTGAKPHYATRAIGGRPEAPGRFPSRDIWEDTPTSMQYTTIVGGPQMDETKSIPEERSTTSAMAESQDDADARATTSFSQPKRPSIPARPARRSKLAEEVKPDDEEDGESDSLSREASREQPPSPSKTKAPPIPDRPKPSVPARPTRTSRSEQANGTEAEVSKTTSRELPPSSTETAKSPPLPKAKPTVPARPGGEKIAALKSGFMNDLNNRLRIGPAAPKSKEIEPETVEEAAPKAPLADARKGRAKGPARRKPAASPSSTPADEVAKGAASFSIFTPVTVWAIDEWEKLQVASTKDNVSSKGAATDTLALEKSIEDNTSVNTSEAAPSTTAAVESLPQLEKVMSDNTVANTEEGALAEPMSPEKALSPTSSGEPGSPETEATNDQKSIQARLEEKLADVGAAPAPGRGRSESIVEDVGVVERDDSDEVGQVVQAEQKVMVKAGAEVGSDDNVPDDTTLISPSKEEAEAVSAQEEIKGVAAS